MKKEILILAGGKSRRMGGQDKALLSIQGESFLRHIVENMKPADNRIWIAQGALTRRDDTALGQNVTIIKDIYQECGPIGGLHSALRVMQGDSLCMAACDMPGITEAFYDFLLTFDQKEADAIIPVWEQKIHPISGIYKRRIMPVVEDMIQKENYKMMYLLEQIHTVYVPLTDIKVARQLKNINTKQDYEQYLKEEGTNP